MDGGRANEIGRHVPRMYRVAVRLLADADAARDVVQDACVKALGKVERFDGRSALATWLHRITVNCAKDALRRDGRRAARVRLRADAPDPDAPGGEAADPSGAPGPLQQAETRELSDLAWRLLEALPGGCRSAFALTQLDGYSYDEAAEIEGQPRGTIASRVFRAKKALLEQMNARIDGRPKS